MDAEFTNEKSLTSQKVEWNATNFFDRQVLANKMQSIASKHGVRLKPNLESTMAKALQVIHIAEIICSNIYAWIGLCPASVGGVG